MCVTCGCNSRSLSPAVTAAGLALAELTFWAAPDSGAEGAGIQPGTGPGTRPENGPEHEPGNSAGNEPETGTWPQGVAATALGDLHYGNNPAGGTVPGLDSERTIHLETSVLAANDALATANRRRFAQAGVLCLNLVSSPGSGKTTLLVETLKRLQTGGRLRAAVIEGDQQTTRDADRIRETGAPAVQVNTGKGCHLDAGMVADAWRGLEASQPDLLFIENVGNLVCPAMWDLGEAAKVAVLSVTEGEDKPLKYPDMFAAAKLMLLNKCDLLPHLRFDVEAALAAARRVNPGIEIIELSAFGGEGFERWLQWLETHRSPR